MTKFTISKKSQQTFMKLGLEYQYMKKIGIQEIHRNRFCYKDGTIGLEVLIKETQGIGSVTISSKGKTKDYPSVNVEKLNLLVINLGLALESDMPDISVRILEGCKLLNHIEFKQ